MNATMYIIFFLSSFMIFWAMVGYPIFLVILGRIFKREQIKKVNYFPTVTIMVVAHNEEKVIRAKLENLISMNYPKNKLEIVITSDNSNDDTNKIVEEFIEEYDDEIKILLYKVRDRKGKTNAQNEAQKFVESEILVMTDANSILKKDAINELVSSFTDDSIKYVCGKLEYVNDSNDVANLESNYWNIDLYMREVESRIQTITAGNGALYAVRNSDYIDVKNIESHDSAFPRYFAKIKKRAIYNKDAIVYEKAGESISDEFKRKVRMNRSILKSSIDWIPIMNIFKYKWYTIFYFGHRMCRNLLWFMHLSLLVTNIYLAKINNIYIYILIAHLLIYFIALLQQFLKTNIKIFRFIHYYIITLFAQWVGVYNGITRKNKPFWEKAESTR